MAFSSGGKLKKFPHAEVGLSASKQHKLTLSVSTLAVPLLSVWFLCSLYFSNVTDWGGWGGGCHGNQIPIRGPHAAKRDPEKEQPTLVTMATHLLGAHRRLVLSPRRWSPLCDWTSLTCYGYPFSFSSSPSLPASVCPSLCVSVFTCV